MCSAPKIPEAQQYQAAQAPVYSDGNTDDEARKRGRRGTIVASMPSSAGATVTPTGKTALGQ